MDLEDAVAAAASSKKTTERLLRMHSGLNSGKKVRFRGNHTEADIK